MLQPLDFSKHSVTDVKVGLKEMFLYEMTDRSRWFLKQVVEELVAEELRDYVEVKRYERSDKRKDCPAFGRGYRTRDLVTTWGVIRDIRVPCTRGGGFQPRGHSRGTRESTHGWMRGC